ncbi:MAG: fatty acid CoA ligase family protein [Lentisphaeria bacterium]|jgi:acyl-CoA synthetase (AMP-forming)/AMP-acid ligase II|nr:fatty acid CoA ligase family protein [Lentisphaeria bacterium]MDY0175509.1 fatty acid CoA ligase family protein [Lentisphaeria bacterium]NLZ60650.1 AMP-binding protein [Lentisphaerota bacterium]
MSSASTNIASLLDEQALQQPRQGAVYFPQGRDPQGRVAYTHLTFAQLKEQSDYYAWALQGQGLRPGMKTLLMIRPSLEFYSLLFAVFKVGAVPILIDPGMGWQSFLEAVRSMQPEAFLGLPAAQLLRVFRRRYFKSVKINITLGSWRLWSGKTLSELRGKPGPFPLCQPEPAALAAVLFTSGSTGPAKGVCYTQDIFQTQVRLLRREYAIKPGEMDLACFPLFSLFSLALGAAVVIPDMNPSKPAQVNPQRILEALHNLPVTYSFGSPALWRQVAKYAGEKNLKLPGLRRIIMAGAPVPAELHESLFSILPKGAETYTPYGATEALPIANFSGSEMLAETKAASLAGKGICVGKPIPEIEARIIAISDEPIASMQEAKILPPGQTGELCVSGACVTAEYYQQAEANRLAKIREGDKLWHRIGDLGYFDDKHRFWFCGRKSHRVEYLDRQGQPRTLFSIPCEAIVNQIEGVRRSALVGIGAKPRQCPAIVIEAAENARLYQEQILREMAKNPLTADIQKLFFHPSLPVDLRHNAKINREALAVWAGKQKA